MIFGIIIIEEGNMANRMEGIDTLGGEVAKVRICHALLLKRSRLQGQHLACSHIEPESKGAFYRSIYYTKRIIHHCPL